MILICSTFVHDDVSLSPPRSVQLSNNKVSFGLENKKLIKKLLVGISENFHFKVNKKGVIAKFSPSPQVSFVAVTGNENHWTSLAMRIIGL